ncbi:GspE/PulE family protein [Roseimaritima ulvae]|uniref:Type II secretion system protein E n=1 Tax=Roseimaritima ulvae TaxID=980254 RepID=A0A5B9QT22_9BACT|nr:ATPase, T2SS/T4P/T4SS family [Roseimaritima ulvae]QEG41052.1 Putative type II secretion system protein E [Roseimaritima ulvae]
MANANPTEGDFEEVDDAPQIEPELNPPETFAQALMEIAAEQRASDLFISDEMDATVIRMRRMGRLKVIRKLQSSYGRRLLNHFRALAGIDIADLARPADGRARFLLDGNREVDVRFGVMPTACGQDMAMRLFDHSRGLVGLDDIGFLDEERVIVERLLTAPSGLILVAGPAGCGKTNSLYAFLNHLNNGQRKIHTLEEPIEYRLPGMHQSQVNVRAGLDFADLLYGCMRQSPDVIMIGEIRDTRTADTAIRAGTGGQLVLATVHAQTAPTAVQNMLALNANRHFLADSLVGVLNQRLIRQLCPHCRVQHEMADPNNGGKQIYFQPGSCDECREEGYIGMTCLPEILEVGKIMTHAIAQGEAADELGRIAVEQGMRKLGDAAMLRITQGIVTPQDAGYVISDPRVRAIATHAPNQTDSEQADVA